MPTRNARNASAFTSKGKLNVRNAKYSRDFDHPIDESCSCYACKNFSMAYLRHLYMAGEILALRLITLHNIHYYMNLVREARAAIFDGSFTPWKKEILQKIKKADPE
jgi:queuine tRNA-ribosyltransferase